MRLFHRTSEDNSRAILKEGFRDVTAHYYKQQHPGSRWSSFAPIDQFTEGTGVMVSSNSSIHDFIQDEPLGSDLTLRLKRWEEIVYDTPADQILDIGLGPFSDPLPGYETIIAVEIPEDVISEFLWRSKITSEQFLVPASLLNSYGPPVVVDELSEDDWLKKQAELWYGKDRWWHWFRNQGGWISEVFEFLLLVAEGCVQLANFIVRVGKFIFNKIRRFR